MFWVLRLLEIKHIMKKFFLSLLATALIANVQAGVEVQQVGGWFESGYVTWTGVSGATDYNVYVVRAAIGRNLIRNLFANIPPTSVLMPWA